MASLDLKYLERNFLDSTSPKSFEQNLQVAITKTTIPYDSIALGSNAMTHAQCI